MGKVVLSLVIWFSFASFGIANCAQANYLVLLHSGNYLRDTPLPQSLVPDGPTYGCWPTGAICGYSCNQWSWSCLAYCTVLGTPTGYACKAGCQYICIYQSGAVFFQCRDIRYIGCACDINPPECGG